MWRRRRTSWRGWCGTVPCARRKASPPPSAAPAGGMQACRGFPDEFEGDPARLTDFTIQVVPSMTCLESQMTTRGRRLPLAAFPDRQRCGLPPPSGVGGGTAAPWLEFWTHRGGAIDGNGQKAAWPRLGNCVVALSLDCPASGRWAPTLWPPTPPVCPHSSPLLLAQEPKIERTCHSCPSQPRKGQIVPHTLVV